MWSIDLSKYGETIRRWWDVAVQFTLGKGSATFGDVHVEIHDVGKPKVIDGGTDVTVDVCMSLTIRNETLVRIIEGHSVEINRLASVVLDRFEWPNIHATTGEIRVSFTEASCPRVEVFGPDPRVTGITLSRDGTGVVEVAGGPDGRITY